jgi:hypothetical protein
VVILEEIPLRQRGPEVSGPLKIILEGLTGTGKSQTIAALRGMGLLPELTVSEDETFGDLMAELADARRSSATFIRRLVAITDLLQREQPASFLLERFHLSYYAQVPIWSHYEEVDRQLVSIGASMVLLTVPDAMLEKRCLLREECGGSDWQDLSGRLGSEERALEVLRSSQQRRLEGLSYTRMRYITIDTTEKTWDAYARVIASWSSSHGEATAEQNRPTDQ